MMQKIKRPLSHLLNEILLRPFGLRVSYRIGRNEIEDIKRLLAKFKVKYIIDGGAYRGEFSFRMQSVFPDALVCAFEPQLSSYEMLSSEVARINPRISVFQYALGEISGAATFFKNQSILTSSLLRSSREGLKYFKDYLQPSGQETVTVIALKDFLNKEKIPYIDLLKLDLQGYELKALCGLGPAISSVKVIYTEVNFLNAYEKGCLFSDLDQYLQKNNFHLYQFYNLVTSPLDGRLLYGDAIFLNRLVFSPEI